ncbi:MAG: chromosome segregation protein SMC [Firmicutes bacterium]|nr:chromosome segregation protein SMC [Bacillota bacterium]
MFLKRLEIMGFKSFADKIKLEFLPGVTGVVGPNGSGKSNISDALRWVLGEQSIKSLRGTRMDDVIFAGTEQRKPLSLAEVTMVLDNSDNSLPVDFTEVSVTRKLFRSGESEYLINKSQVRLRDVLDLFYDTGLGKEAYSVIGQGKIDSILSVKAEERRSIFEEAAGIIKYKSRKHIAERKLEDTDRNLLRLQDILTELQGQLGPLESQADLAQKYLKLKEQLTEVEINYYGGLLNQFDLKLADLKQSKADWEEKHQDFEGEESIIESEVEEARLLLLTQDDQITSLNENYYRIQNQIDKYSEQINSLTSKSQDLETQLIECRNNVADNALRKEAILKELSGIDQEIATVKSKLTNSSTILTELELGLNQHNQLLKGLETEEQNLKTEFIEVLNEIASLKNNANSAALKKEFLQKQIDDCVNKMEFLAKQLSELEKDNLNKEGLLNEIGLQINRFHQVQAELAQNVILLEEEFTSVESKNLDWKERIRGLESKIGLLEEMEKGFQGYFQGVKVLLAEASEQPFYRYIRGIVADLIQVKPGMELAIETALGSSLQNIVIEHDQYAQAAISYLKKQGKGRATFLPLNLINVQGAKTDQYQGVIQQHSSHSALSLLHFDSEYRPVLNYLLGNTIIAPDLNTAVRLSSKVDKGFRIVTPEGDLVNPGGSITGGSVDKRRLGLLSRKREIEDFKKEKNESQSFLEKGIETAKEIRNKLQVLNQQMESSKKEEHDVQLKKATLEREIQTIEQNSNRAQQEENTYRNQWEEMTAESSRFDLGAEELQHQISNKEASLKEIEARVNELTAKIQDANLEKESKTQGISELKSTLSAGSQEEHGKIALKDRLHKQLEELDTHIETFHQKQDQIIGEQAKARELVGELQLKIDSEKDRLSSQEGLVAGAKEEKDQVMLKIKDLESKQRSFRRKSNEFQNQIHKLDLAINQILLEQENIERNLAEDYDLNWRNLFNPVYRTPENAKDLVEQLKSNLKDLGPVNIAAIDDYRQIKERHDFLWDQSQDLIKAKASLEKVILEIEGTITKRFSEAFQQIRKEFIKLFAELFEGGNADLFLIDPEQPLESGIEIIAQPPGKKLQSLSLLSGGERAMTAIALLFAILTVKPSPFCILDEIDATLDEVNVQRFSRLLELFSKSLQFIVVTHRRGTMEAANALYGVTMQEHGVSKLISLDLMNEKVG